MAEATWIDLAIVATSDWDDCQIFGGNIAWVRFDGNGQDILFGDGQSITQITDNHYDEGYPHISGTNVVWFKPWDVFF